MSNVIWVDDKDNVLGEITRQKAHQEGLLHRVAVIYLIDLDPKFQTLGRS
jgi:isopentenyldiphosphate isomerase